MERRNRERGERGRGTDIIASHFQGIDLVISELRHGNPFHFVREFPTNRNSYRNPDGRQHQQQQEYDRAEENEDR